MAAAASSMSGNPLPLERCIREFVLLENVFRSLSHTMITFDDSFSRVFVNIFEYLTKKEKLETRFAVLSDHPVFA